MSRLMPLDRGSVTGRVALEGRVIHIHDVQADPEFTLMRGTKGDERRTMLGVPLIKDGCVIGAVILHRKVVRPFTERQIDLVRTFGDQAVIAIENARLFEEVQARTSELTEALEYQTATSDVLSVISRSKFDLQPVVDTIVDTAIRLCSGRTWSALAFRRGRLPALTNLHQRGRSDHKRIARQTDSPGSRIDRRSGRAWVSHRSRARPSGRPRIYANAR